MIKSSMTLQKAALVSSLALHTGVAAWMAWPTAEGEMPQQQVVDIRVVMLSQLEPKPDLLSSPQPLPREASAGHAVPVQHAPPHVSTPLTTGPQAPDTTDKLAALTDPVFNATYLHNEPPSYPEEARRDGVEGKVLLDVAVTPEGNAQDVNIQRSSGDATLDRAARNAVRAWHFVPARRGDTQIEARVVVPVEFRLE